MVYGLCFKRSAEVSDGAGHRGVGVDGSPPAWELLRHVRSRIARVVNRLLPCLAGSGRGPPGDTNFGLSAAPLSGHG